MRILGYANLALRFLLELASLAALAYGGATLGGSTLASAALTIVLPLIAAFLWGAIVAPKARFIVAEWVRLLAQLAVFGSAALALGLSISRYAALSFAAIALLHLTLYYALGQHSPRR